MANQVKDIIAILEKHYPLYLTAPWDNSGLQLGSFVGPAAKVGIALELDPQIVEAALRAGLDMIITHHPLFFKEIKTLQADTVRGRMIYQLISSNITVYAAHTNLDAAPQGLNQHLAEMLGCQEIEPLFPEIQDELYKIAVYVPHSHLGQVQQALAEAGAGHIGKYSGCSFRTPGIGSFLPEAGSRPFIGSVGVLEEVEEYRLETIAAKPVLERALQAMHSAHPYEEVAYDVYPLINRGRTYSMGRKGRLCQPCSLDDLARRVKEVFKCEALRVVGASEQTVQRVAMISGAGGATLPRFNPTLADVVITGDVKYHEAQEARLNGINTIDVGHQELEKHMVPLVKQLLQNECASQHLPTEVVELHQGACFRHL